MGRNTLVINSKFTPMSYTDLVSPLRYATEEHHQVEEAYGELSTAADMWKDIAENEKDSKAASMYAKYSEDLRQQADNLAMYGLNGNSRRELFNMKQRYASEIRPIENAYNARVEDIKLQRELSAKDPSLLWSQSAASASIDSYLGGKRPEYYSVSGDDMYKRAATGAKAISDRYFRTEEGTLFNGAYWDLVQKQGINPAQALSILKNTGEFPEFNQLVERLKEGSNYGRLDAEGQNNIDNRILEGINAGLGYTEKHSPEQNWVMRENMSYNNSLRLAQAKAALSGSGASGANMLPMNAIALQTPGAGSRKENRKVGRVVDNPIYSALSSGSSPAAAVDMRKALKKATLMDNGHLRSRAGDSRFQMFDSNGNILSRDRFIAQGADSKTKANLGRIYDDFVKDVQKSGYAEDVMNFNSLSGYLGDTAAANNSALSFAVELPIGTIGGSNDEVLNKIKSKTGGGVQIEEVKSFNGDKVVTSGKPLDLSKIDEKSVNFAMTYDGLIVFDGTNFGLIRPENLGSLGVSAMQNMAIFKELQNDVRELYDRDYSTQMSYEEFLQSPLQGGMTVQDYLTRAFQAAQLDMIRALNYSFSSTAINPLAKGNLIGSVYDEDEE